MLRLVPDKAEFKLMVILDKP